MAGKSYSIKEMKDIVDYLTENKLYGEIKARKMWMNYASSQRTTRTWQSLKETFLKRILPDIHNPYYRLSIEQVNSFRAGYDIGDRNKNKLEVHTVSDESNGPNQNDTPHTSNGNDNKQENNAGENFKSSKIPSRSRSSADTVIIDTCYETAEDIQKDLESPGQKNKNGENKSLRDCITYSEPLTPMLQEVLDDFQSEPENELELSEKESSSQLGVVRDDENLEIISNEVSKIVMENQNEKSDHIVNSVSNMDSVPSASVEEVIEQNQSEPTLDNISDPTQKKNVVTETTTNNESEVQCLDDQEQDINNGESIDNKEPKKNETTKNFKKPVEIVHSTSNAPSTFSGTLNISNNTPDASLPNNPEALKKRASNENQVEEIAAQNKPESKISRKRLHSEGASKSKEKKQTISNLEIKKKKANSESESKKVTRIHGKAKAKSVEPMNKLTEIIVPKKKKEANKNNSTRLEDVIEQPSTSNVDNIEKVPLTSGDQNGSMNESLEVKNPVLQNLSLYEEQFNKTKYKSSESSDIDCNKKNDKNVSENQNEIVILKSHTETETDTEGPSKSPKKKHRDGVAPVQSERDRGLAKVFGFASGTGHSNSKRRLSHRRRTISHNNITQNNSDSSQWTSESDGEVYVSPPRGRKNRPTKKYLKPHYARIHSLEEEGGLFVMYGRKIYPLIKDGKLVKHYLSYLPESESDEENYWKSKYEEEKKNVTELKKLLKKAKSPKEAPSTSSCVVPDRFRRSISSNGQPQESSHVNDREVCLPGHEEKNVEVKTEVPENIKIKFTTKNEQEIHLEGNWPQLQNALEHVVHIFQKPQAPVSENKPRIVERAPSSSGIASPVVISSIEGTGVDPEIHEKVSKIEGKIFEEIEERDKKEQDPDIKPDTNVTKRKPGRQTRSSRSISESPSKRAKMEMQEQKAPGNDINNTNATGIENNESKDVSKKPTRTSRKILSASPTTNETTTIQTRRSKSIIDTSNIAENVNADEDILYMLPPKTKKQNINSTETTTRSKLKKR